MVTFHTLPSSSLGARYPSCCFTPGLKPDYWFPSINVTKQAFIDASKASNPILSYGVDGIVGLGFTKLSGIDGALTKAGITDGKSLLYNLFADNPKEPNFIAFSLQRTSEVSGDVEGSFTIGTSLPLLEGRRLRCYFRTRRI